VTRVLPGHGTTSDDQNAVIGMTQPQLVEEQADPDDHVTVALAARKRPIQVSGSEPVHRCAGMPLRRP
jgi:predicted SPOUT superfamily RNA methylase MTH1